MRLAIVAALALGAAAVPASAAPVITFNGNTGGAAPGAVVFQNYDSFANGASIGTGAFVATNSVAAPPAANGASRPLNAEGKYAYVIGGGSYSVGFGPTDLFSFVVGSLDTYNTLRLTFNDGTFTDYVGGAIIGGLPFASGNTSSSTSNGRVTYTVASGPLITGATFTSTTDSFEFDSLAVRRGAVPEPATWGMMILGFGAIGGAMRRRKDRNALVAA